MRLTFACIALTMLAAPAVADPIKIKIACTATSDCASAMIATYDGVFAKHGIDADMTLIGINTNIPPAIASDSVQIGGPTSTVFLQAVDGGLDLVAVAGATVMDPTEASLIVAVQRNGLNLSKPADFIGKKVGVPGIGAFLHVLFRKWLIDGGVDPSKVNYVEVTFPNQNDTLKSGAVDAVLTAEPMTSRIVGAGNGTVAAHYAAELHRTDPIIEYVATRDWAEKNPQAVKAFREAIAETAEIVNKDHAKAAEAQARFTKMNVDLVKKSPPSLSEPKLKPQDFAWWIEVMKQQGMLQSDIDMNKLVLPVTEPATSAARAALAIEADILAGRLAPDSRLGIVETAARYGVGATPLREALSRLAARGLVDARGNRGFSVTPISCPDLADIVLIRTAIEREALRLAMARGDSAWEADILAALHQLRRGVDKDPQGFREGDAAFDALHKRFHAALIAACGSPRLIAAQAQLYDEAYRYRRLMMQSFDSLEDFLETHERLAGLVISRAAENAAAAIELHIAATLTRVYPESAR